jgi:glycosyltransferase involved in cell wall biosynthesis
MRVSSRCKLHWICWVPTHYNDFLFRSLAADPSIDLTVHFIESRVPSHPWKAQLARGFRSRTYHRIVGLDWHLLSLAARDKSSFFVIGGWHEPTIMAVINMLIVRHRPFAIWTDTPDVYRDRPVLKAVLRTIWLRRIFAHARYLMGTGLPALSILEQIGGPKNKLVNFPYFVDLNTFTPASESKNTNPSSPTIFLSSGRLVNSHKGYDIAIKALSSVASSIQSTHFIYKIAGSGPDREILEDLAKNLGILENLKFLGWLEPNELSDFYKSGDIFIHPSHFDPYGVAVLEAMASGIPVIGSNKAGSVIDRIQHMKNGLIHCANDIDDLSEKISYVFSDYKQVQAMGREARRTAELWPVTKGVEMIKSMIYNLS